MWSPLGRPLDGVERGDAIAQPLQLGVDLLLARLGLAPTDLQAAVFAELGRRHDADLDRELQRLPPGG